MRTMVFVALAFCVSLPLHAAELTDRNINLRGSLGNSRLQFEREMTGHVAFMGGSITEMNGYRPMFCDWLRERFPETAFKFSDAGIASTCSTTGAMRLERDVLSKGPVDLFLVEFAVNDDQDATHARRDCIRGMEGIVQQVRKHNQNADIIIIYFCNPGIVEALQADETPLTIAAHEAVARHYDVPSVNLAREVSQQIMENSLTWKQYGGTHPAPTGNRIAADMVALLLSQAWKDELRDDAKKQPHPMPTESIDENSYAKGRFISPGEAKADAPWRFDIPNWQALPGSLRSRFADQKLLHADKPGSEATLKFIGRAIGAYVLAGPDAGMVEVSIDGREFKPVDLYHRFSKGLHYPRTVMFRTDLKDREHTLRMRISREKNKASQGHAVRILQFTAN